MTSRVLEFDQKTYSKNMLKVVICAPSRDVIAVSKQFGQVGRMGVCVTEFLPVLKWS